MPEIQILLMLEIQIPTYIYTPMHAHRQDSKLNYSPVWEKQDIHLHNHIHTHTHTHTHKRQMVNGCSDLTIRQGKQRTFYAPNIPPTPHPNFSNLYSFFLLHTIHTHTHIHVPCKSQQQWQQRDAVYKSCWPSSNTWLWKTEIAP